MLSNIIAATNTNTNELSISADLYISIIAIICVLAVISIGTILLSIVFYLKNKKLRTYIKNKITDNEINIILKYRKLSEEEKTIFNNTLSTLNNHKNSNDPLDY